MTIRIVEIDPRARYLDGKIPPGRPERWKYPLLTVHTDEGIDGYSMAYGPHGDGEALADILQKMYLREIRGADPFESEAIWQRIHARQRHLYNQTETLHGVVDVAIWDIKGKALGKPISQLLGVCRNRMPSYASALSELYTAEQFFEEAVRMKAAGYHGYKLQVRCGPEADIPRLRSAREAVGEGFPLMHDPNAAYTFEEALRVGRVLEELDYTWFEEPVPDHNLARLNELARTLSVPILPAETVRLSELQNYLREGVFSLLRGDVLIKAGITGLRKAMAACEVCGAGLEIHTTNTPLLDMANLHVACASPNTRFIETHHPVFRFGLKGKPLDIDAEGCIALPGGPGLGVKLDWDWIDNHTSSVVNRNA